MKFHQDGTLEGTPEEIAAFMKLKDPMFGKMYVPIGMRTGDPYIVPFTTTSVDATKYPGSDIKPYTLDGTGSPYKSTFAYNGDPVTNGSNAKTAHN